MNHYIPIHVRAGSDVSGRATAAKLRVEAIKAVSNGCKAVLDFANVRTVSHSFADELLAVMVDEMGEPWFKQNVEVQNLTDSNKTSILSAIIHRQKTA